MTGGTLAGRRVLVAADDCFVAIANLPAEAGATVIPPFAALT